MYKIIKTYTSGGVKLALIRYEDGHETTIPIIYLKLGRTAKK
jgi:hypothetical protein